MAAPASPPIAGHSVAPLRPARPDRAGPAFRVEQQDRIDVGAVVQLARALLAQRERGEPAGVGILHPACTTACMADRARGRRNWTAPSSPVVSEGPGQIANRQRQCQRQAFTPQRHAGIVDTLARRFGERERLVPLAVLEQRAKLLAALYGERQEGRMVFERGSTQIASQVSSPVLVPARFAPLQVR